MKKNYSLTILFFFLLTLSSQLSAKNYTVKLHNGDLQIQQLSPSLTLAELKLSLNSKYSILQFTEIPTETDKLMLKNNGIELLEYLPHYAFIVELKNVSNQTLSNLKIKGATAFTASYKLSKSIVNQENPPHAVNGNEVDLVIEPHLNVSKYDFVTYLNAIGAQFLTENSAFEYEEIRIPKNRIAELANSAIIKFIDYVEALPEPEDQRGRTLHRANMLDSDHPLGRKYDGTGVSIAIADDAQIGPHIDIKGRVTSFAAGTNGSHGDMTTGIAMGAGNLNPDYRGMATGAYLYYYDIGGYPHISQAVSNLSNRGVVITSTSFSEGCNAGYTNTTRAVDQQVRQNPVLLHVFSAGNSANSTCGSNAYGAGIPWGTITGGRKQGKSVIATGNLEYTADLTPSSSRGPAADGRIKPDICANGTGQMSTNANNTYQTGGGTSAAAPGIAGLAAQMYHGYKTLHGGSNPDAGLIKSAMLNTARDLGNKGPDFFYGWGRVNAHRAMKLIEENRFLDSTISQNGFNVHTVSVPSSISELKFMVYWTDYEGSTSASLALVNNIDLKVITPMGDTILPYVLNSSPNASSLAAPATRGIDDLNNVEQVEIDTVNAGLYTILVDGKLIPQGPQKYFLSWETKTDSIEITYPSGGESFTPGTRETIRWDATLGTGTTTLEYSLDSGLTWTNFGTTNNTSFRHWDWTVPNAATGDALIRITNNGRVGISAFPFSIIQVPTALRTDYRCTDSVKLVWNSVPGATAYEISMLGATHMDSIGTSNTNSFVVYNLNLANDNWFSVKALGNGIIGKRALAVQIGNTVDNCPFDYDVNVDRFLSPLTSYVINCQTKTPISVSLINEGDSTINMVPLRLKIGGATYLDTLFGMFPSNTTRTFIFKDSLPVGITGNLNIEVINELSTDQNPFNNSVIKSINLNSTSFTLPYTNDFENFVTCATTTNCGATICNLNGGWLNAQNGEEDIIDLRVDAGGTPSNGTGPSLDHNPGTSFGKYLYSEASGVPVCSNSDAVTISPCFDLSNTIQPEFSFWYHMNGTSVGSIRVDALVNGVWINNITTPIIGSQGNSWIKRTINMSNYTGQTVSFRITVTTGTSWSSDIAIDDVSFIDVSTSLNEVVKEDLFNVYPNPSTGLFNVVFKNIPTDVIEIKDMSGRLVTQFKTTEKVNQINLSHLSKGMYFLSVQNSAVIKKLIIY